LTTHSVSLGSTLTKIEKVSNATYMSVFILDGFNLIFIFALIMLAIFKHRIYGFTLWLMIGLELSVVFWIAANILTYRATNQLVAALNTSERKQAYDNWLVAYQQFSWLNIIVETLDYVVHWIFAMKYWSLSLKLELIQTN
jgi:hypothetical protein